MRTNLLGSLEGVLSGKRDGQNVLVGVDQGVGNGHNSGVVEGQGDGSDGLDTGHEAVDELRLINVKNLGGEEVAVVIDGHNSHTVGKRRDVEHVEEGSLGGSDTGTSSNDLDVADDFNGTTGNLGGDTESLEERGLAGFHSGVTSRDNDVLGGEGTGTSGGSNLVGNDDLADFLEVSSSEDESDVALDVREETLELGVLGEDGAEGTADHGVLAHQDNTLATEGGTDLMHLVGANIVDVDQEDGGYMET